MRLILTFLILFGNVASADSNSDASVMNSADQRTATDEIAKILAKHVFILDRELLTFHYEHDPQGGYTPSAYNPKTLQDIQQHLIGWSHGYFDDKIRDGNSAGPGLYLALDPYSTRSYGGSTNPQLYVVPIARGARLLDTKTDLDVKDEVAMKQVAKRFDCLTVLSATGDFESLFTAIRESEKLQCRQIAINALAANALHGIFYGYSGAQLPGCRMRGYAINVVDADILKLDQAALFTDTKKIEGAAVSDQLNRLFNDASNDFGLTYQNFDIGNASAPPKTLLTLEGNPKAYTDWKSKVLYACGKRWSNEKREDVAFQQYQNENFAPDKDIQAALLSLRYAFKRRSSNLNFTLTQMNQLEKVQAAGLSLPLDTLVKAKNAYRDYSNGISDEDRRVNAEKILGEWKSGVKLGDGTLVNREGVKFFFSIWKPHQIQRSLLYRAYAFQHWGPGLASFSVMEILENYGVVQPMSIEAMHDVDLKNKRLEARNRDQFKAMLASCTALYNDKAISLTAIQAGPCGIRQTLVPGMTGAVTY